MPFPRSIFVSVNTSLDFDIIIIGGGAAGFFAAINAAGMSGKKVAIIEKSGKVLSKVLISGGGRCNVTHACFEDKELVMNYPRGGRELLGAFSRFSTSDTLHWFEKRGVEIVSEDDGRMFPITNDSSTIADCLLNEARKQRVEIIRHTEIVDFRHTSTKWHLRSADGREFQCDKLLIAAGGFPKSSSYDFLRKLGHTIVEPVPSLFTFNMPKNKVAALMGVSLEKATVKISGTHIETTGPLLITHWGMSGPAILKASAFGARDLSNKKYVFTAVINWLPEFEDVNIIAMALDNVKKETSAKFVMTSLPFEIPKRLWQFLVEKAGIGNDTRWADLNKKQMSALGATLVADRYEVSGKTTFKEEFVTCGGVSLKEVEFRTMESRLVKNLYFAGEILDIDAITGGFNFQNAWTTGWIAAKAMSGTEFIKEK